MRSLADDILRRVFPTPEEAAAHGRRKDISTMQDPRPANEHVVRVHGLRRVARGWEVRVKCASGVRQIGVFPEFPEAINALKDALSRPPVQRRGDMYGVTYNTATGLYHAVPRYHHQPRYLGRYPTPERASVAVRLFLLWVHRGYTDIPSAPYGR